MNSSCWKIERFSRLKGNIFFRSRTVFLQFWFVFFSLLKNIWSFNWSFPQAFAWNLRYPVQMDLRLRTLKEYNLCTMFGDDFCLHFILIAATICCMKDFMIEKPFRTDKVVDPFHECTRYSISSLWTLT